jgi:hypothetical protein
VAAVRRYRDEIGSLEWAAPMDWMCEPFMLAKTGLTIAVHQARTVANYVELRDLAPDLPFIPVLQGWCLGDYVRCAEMFQRAGVDLTAEPLVGVGSVCRRQATGEIEVIVHTLASMGLRLHGFGVKAGGLQRYADCLASADSLAWSSRRGGRRRFPAAATPTARTACATRRSGGSGRWGGWAWCRCTCGWRRDDRLGRVHRVQHSQRQARRCDAAMPANVALS